MTELSAAIAAATERWPGITVSAAKLAELVDPDGTEEIRPDLVLACACLEGDRTALALFEERILTPVAARLNRSGIGTGAAEEAISRLRSTLFVSEPGTKPRLASYSGRGDLRGWLEVVATREAYKVARREPPAGDDHILASLPDDDDLELRHIKAQHRAELGRAFAEALALLGTRERLILRQRYLDGLTFDDVAALHGVHRITVMRWLARIEKSLLRDIRRVLSKRLQLGAADVEHLVDDARSRLDLSLHGLLATEDSP
ncbi:MAG: putative DNA-binding regulatory protein [Myxococcales bacterium]|nr:putative DNA-binding regulatory protein [Myxococcales bacterium]